MILSTKGRKMTLSVFFILLAFLGFSQVFSSVMTQVIERMFETIGLHSPTPDLGDTIEEIMDHALVCWIFWSLSQRNSSSVGPACEGMERYGKIFAIVMTAILFGLFHANFDQLFSRVSLV